MNKHKQDGFAHIFFVIMLLVVITTVGALAYARISKKNEQKSTNRTPESKTETSKEKSATDKHDYNWSSMSQGPYHDKVAFVISSSLTQWPKTGETMIEHASVPDVINKDGVLYAYFVDVSQDNKPEQIGIMTSNDNGETWSERQFANIEGIVDKIPVDPAPFITSNGKFRLYYLDFSVAQTNPDGEHSIYSAISDDGINFTQEEGVRFRYDAIYDPEVIEVDGQFRMYVGTGNLKVLSATSSDGLDFEYEGVALSGGAIPNVIYENNTYYLYTGGIDISTSTDGRTFTKTTNKFNVGGVTADPGVAKLDNGQYIMVYKTSNNTQAPTTPPIN